MKHTTIYLDMDGTFANLYAVEGWLEMLNAMNPTPYAQAKPIVRMATLAYYINALRKCGFRVGVISWLSKGATCEYCEQVNTAKLAWLKKHLPSVEFDEIHIIPYGMPKYKVASEMGILVDDEKHNRDEWVDMGGTAVDAKYILDLFKFLKEGL